MKVIARHATKTYDVAIIQYETGNQHYWVVTVAKDAPITGQETTVDRGSCLEIMQESADREWARRMDLRPSETKGPFTTKTFTTETFTKGERETSFVWNVREDETIRAVATNWVGEQEVSTDVMGVFANLAAWCNYINDKADELQAAGYRHTWATTQA